MESVRIDKWLWAARMFKTRSAASTACAAGHVKIDGESAKASKTVKRGSQVEVVTPGGRRILDVIELGDRRGPASVAQTLYDDQTPAPPPEMKFVQPLGGHRERGAGRPSKRDRRRLEKLRDY